MAIQKRTSLDPTSGANNWATRVGQSGPNWNKGIKAPRRLPNEDPAKNEANWLAGVAAAGPRFQSGISGPNYLTRLEKGADAKQASYTGSGAAHKDDYASAAGKLYPQITAALATLPPRGPRGTNSARSTAFQDAMHRNRGTARKS